MDHPSAEALWQSALVELRQQVSHGNYETWLKDTKGLSFDGELFLVGVPTAFGLEWLEKRLGSLIKKTISTKLEQPIHLKFKVISETGTGDTLEVADRKGRQRRDGPETLPLRHAESPDGLRAVRPRLNPKYTFASFIVGSCNRLAHAAAMGAAENPGRGYNPLFIYGGVGLGKTHLLHAIGHMVMAKQLRIIYVSSEQFTNEFINSIRERRNEEFRSKYRGADILLIDDIQFIADKEQTQEEFFHTFNDLHSSGRQIVVSSDRPPGSLPLLEDRLRSRFEWGLIADIQPPDLETRLAILRAKAEEHAVMVPEDVLDLLARRYQHNIRELEGSLNRIVAYARLTQSPLSVDLANLALADISIEANRRPTVSADAIINEVASYFGVRPEELRNKGRTKRVALPRQIAMFLMIEVGQMRIASVGSELGGRDHSTVHHGWQKIMAEANANSRLRRDLSEIQNRLFSAQR